MSRLPSGYEFHHLGFWVRLFGVLLNVTRGHYGQTPLYIGGNVGPGKVNRIDRAMLGAVIYIHVGRVRIAIMGPGPDVAPMSVGERGAW